MPKRAAVKQWPVKGERSWEQLDLEWLTRWLLDTSDPFWGLAQGLSSEQLILYCLGAKGYLDKRDRPRDEADFWRCARAVQTAPPHRLEQARDVLAIYSDWYLETTPAGRL